MRVIVVTLLIIFAFSYFPYPVSAYTPPENIEVEIYRLTDTGAIWLHPVTNTPQLCATDDTDYGCTADEDYPYPYGNSNPVLIPIETDYLLDVISQEMGTVGIHDTARHAQAIATRTYAYFFDNAGLILNNSAEDHVFIPYRFEVWDAQVEFSLNVTDPCQTWSWDLLPEQHNICDAVNASKWYITDGVPDRFPADEFPSFTEYFADIPFQTITNTTQINPPSNTELLYPHLIGVQEPISQPPVSQNGHGRGLSQLGASRWGHGNLGWQGNLDDWSAQFDTMQILVHYYSGIHIRDENETILTPPYRWNPLQIDWNGADVNNRVIYMSPSETRNIAITVQNTGTKRWECGPIDYDVTYRWVTLNGDLGAVGYTSVCDLLIGNATTPLPFTITAPAEERLFRLRFDISQYDFIADETMLFSDPENNWDDYDFLVCVGECFQEFAHMPIISFGSNTRSDGTIPVPTAVELSTGKAEQTQSTTLIVVAIVLMTTSVVWLGQRKRV